MPSYYSEHLSAERLKLCYEVAPPSVKNYLAAEIKHLIDRVSSSERVLELGCGYGRVLRELFHTGASVVGIDTSLQSLSMAQTFLGGEGDYSLLLMDAVCLGFPSGYFDAVCCIQNGISAFHVDQRELLSEAVRVSKPGGRVLFSSYAEKFWDDRLEWFRIQSSQGLVGEIDEALTANGVIVTKDGFTATTVTPEQFLELSQDLGSSRTVTVVSGSSVFCEISV